MAQTGQLQEGAQAAGTSLDPKPLSEWFVPLEYKWVGTDFGASSLPPQPRLPFSSGALSLAFVQDELMHQAGDVLSVPSPAQRGRNKSSQIETLLNQIGQV